MAAEGARLEAPGVGHLGRALYQLHHLVRRPQRCRERREHVPELLRRRRPLMWWLEGHWLFSESMHEHASQEQGEGEERDGYGLTCRAPLRDVTYSMKDTRDPADIRSSSTRFPPACTAFLGPHAIQKTHL